MKGWLTALQALRELGLRPLVLYGLYQAGLRSGHYRRLLRAPESRGNFPPTAYHLENIIELPDAQRLSEILGEKGCASLLMEADEIVGGRVRLFGGEPVLLELAPPGPLSHWTAYETGAASAQPPNGDIKFLWEPCRFGWAVTLSRAYLISQEERYSEAFWRFTEDFLASNPPYMGPNWLSAQEVGIRLMILVLAGQVFSASVHATLQRKQRLAQAVAWHAQRIPATLIYARSQNNNHLLSEAAGLYTAALALPHHPQARRWRAMGWHWFNQAICDQVAENGTYIQHSTNYHRLMLQLALWVGQIARKDGQIFPQTTLVHLAAASRWLLALLDPVSGQVPNLGANDGAYIFPFSGLGFKDFRPVVQAACAAFDGSLPLPDGAWDEMRLWFQPGFSGAVKPDQHPGPVSIPAPDQVPGILHSPTAHSWAYLRLAEFQDRPGHADLLHLDLWWRGINLAMDAGTYLYNAPPPWDNSLTGTLVHNTVTVDGMEQMRRAGRFLYLDWVNTQQVSGEQSLAGCWTSLAASHPGYRRLGITHQRRVSVPQDGGWLVEDLLTAAQGVPELHTYCLHWLLPDWPWFIEEQGSGPRLRLESPYGEICLVLNGQFNHLPLPGELNLARAGERVFGSSPAHPTWGWSSPAYGDKIPALGVRFTLESPPPVMVASRWIFPEP